MAYYNDAVLHDVCEHAALASTASAAARLGILPAAPQACPRIWRNRRATCFDHFLLGGSVAWRGLDLHLLWSRERHRPRHKSGLEYRRTSFVAQAAGLDLDHARDDRWIGIFPLARFGASALHPPPDVLGAGRTQRSNLGLFLCPLRPARSYLQLLGRFAIGPLLLLLDRTARDLGRHPSSACSQPSSVETLNVEGVCDDVDGLADCRPDRRTAHVPVLCVLRNHDPVLEALRLYSVARGRRRFGAVCAAHRVGPRQCAKGALSRRSTRDGSVERSAGIPDPPARRQQDKPGDGEVSARRRFAGSQPIDAHVHRTERFTVSRSEISRNARCPTAHRVGNLPAT